MLYISVDEIKYGTVGATFNVAFSVPIEELPLLRELHDKYAELNMKSFSLTARQADTPQTETQTETENSNLTFEKRTMRDCYNCKRYETEGECVECHYEPKDEPQTESYYTDATHFGKAKGGSTTTNTTDTSQTDFWSSVTREDWLKAHGLDTPQTERSACDTCQWYNSGIPCGVEPSVCKREITDTPQTDCGWGKPNE